MFPKGTFILLAGGAALLALGYGLSFLMPTLFDPVPIWIRLPVLLVVAAGAGTTVMGGCCVAVGIADAAKKRRR